MQPPGVVIPGMVGRERERAELAGLLDGARHGRGRAVLVLGEAGMGKSVLTDWLVAHARTVGFRAGRGFCSAAGMPPLWPWRQALDGTVSARWQTGNPDRTPVDRDLVAAAVVEAIAEVVLDQPRLIVVEDLHWADPASVLVARAVADAVAALPVMLLLTCRDDPSEPADEVRGQLADLPTSVRRMQLSPLDLAGVAQLSADNLGYELSGEAVLDLHTRTGGNPFFVQEVTRLMAARGPAAALVVPPGVREVLQRRLARLSQHCVSFLTVAAVAAETSAGEVVEDALVCAVSDTEEVTAAQLLDEAAAARLVDHDPTALLRYRFRHTLVREVLMQGLTGVERGQLHARVAAELQNGADRSGPASRLAHHWSRASGSEAREQAAAWSLRAARDAMAGSGFEAAAAYYARALTGPSTDQVGVSIEYGEALQLGGDSARARDVLLHAARAASAAGRPVELARAALALGGGLAGFEVPIRDDDQADLLRLADAALPAGDVALRAAVRGRLSLALAGTAPLTERVQLAEAAVRMARRAGDGQIESAVLAAYCDAVAGPDYVTERIAAGTRMLQLVGDSSGSALPRHATELLARRLLLVACLELGDFAGADEQAAAYERLARRMNIARYSWLPEIWRAMHALLDGHPDIALQHAAAAAGIGQRAGSFNAELMVFTVRMHAYLDRGTPEQFAGDITDLLDLLGPTGMPATYSATPARVLLVAGDESHARAVLRAFLTGSAETMPKDAEWLEAHWALTDIALHLDDKSATAGLFEALLPYERLWAVDGIGGAVLGNVAEQVGRLAARLGRSDEAAQYLGAARERYARAGVVAPSRRMDAWAEPASVQESPDFGRLRRDGQVWVVEWRGRRSLVADSKGLRDLAVLLGRPGRPVPVLELVKAAGGPPAAAAGADLGPVLDDSARQAYRRRLAELDRELDDADADADLARAERLRFERSMLVDELTGALGLGGRPRIAGDPTERARKAVTMRIRAAIEAIGRQDELLGRHLRVSVRTGRFCSYQPENAVSWQS